MPKLRPSIVGLSIVLALIVALTLVASAFYPPAIYRCTVYVNDDLAGAGLTVKAYVGTETAPRDGAEAVTDEYGVAILKVPIITAADLAPSPKAVSFTVEGAAAIEDPDVNMTLEAMSVALYVNDVSAPPVAWDLTYGLIDDDAAVNLWQYPGGAVQVTLADVEATIPDDLSVIWHYAGTVEGWLWFTPGWPESTLDTLEAGKYYIGIALSACQWEIPQD
jgi:hypothetical protein